MVWGTAPRTCRWDPLVFLLSAEFAEGEKREGDLRTVYFESFCHWKATKCGLKYWAECQSYCCCQLGWKWPSWKRSSLALEPR